jgi:hypothetical protein
MKYILFLKSATRYFNIFKKFVKLWLSQIIKKLNFLLFIISIFINYNDNDNDNDNGNDNGKYVSS